MAIRDKKGWIRIVEAFVAILLITGVLLIVINEGYLKKEDISSKVYTAQKAILNEIRQDDDLRNEIFNITPPVNWDDEDFPNLTKYRINDRTPNYLNCEAILCGIGDSCKLNKKIDNDIYAQSIVLTANLDVFSPRQLKLFCWVGDIGDEGIPDYVCVADFDGDSDVDGDDLGIMEDELERTSDCINPIPSEGECVADFNCDGVVDNLDGDRFFEDFARSVYNDQCPSFFNIECDYNSLPGETCDEDHTDYGDGSCGAVFNIENNEAGTIRTILGADWNLIRSGSAGLVSNSVEISAQEPFSNVYSIQRAFIPFNTTSIPDSATITSALLRVFVLGSSVGTLNVGVVQTTQASPQSLEGEDYDQCGALDGATEGASRKLLGENKGGAGGFEEIINLNPDGLSWIDKTGYTLLGLRTENDLDNILPTDANHTDLNPTQIELRVNYTVP